MTREEAIENLNELIETCAVPSEKRELLDSLKMIKDTSKSTLAEFLGWEEGVVYEAGDEENLIRIVNGVIETKFSSQEKWFPILNEATQEHYDYLRSLKKATLRYIIPLPHLKTTDGKQQYLTHSEGKFFVSRRNKKLRQTWKKEHLSHIPEEYRQYAVRVDELYENEL